jgi:hypothetical protein
MTFIQVLPEYLCPDKILHAVEHSGADVIVSGMIVDDHTAKKIFGVIHYRGDDGSWRKKSYWKINECGINTPSTEEYKPCFISLGAVSIGVLCCLDGQQTPLIKSLYAAMNTKVRVIAVPAHLSQSSFNASDREYQKSNVLFCNGNPEGAPSFARLYISDDAVISSNSVAVKIMLPVSSMPVSRTFVKTKTHLAY